MSRVEWVIATVMEECHLSLQQLSALCGVEPQWVLNHIDDGLLSAAWQDEAGWVFTYADLLRAKRILSVERVFDAPPELAALVADLQEELEALRRQLNRSPDC
jgi:chaperone modulatory protein CbpM